MIWFTSNHFVYILCGIKEAFEWIEYCSVMRMLFCFRSQQRKRISKTPHTKRTGSKVIDDYFLFLLKISSRLLFHRTLLLSQFAFSHEQSLFFFWTDGLLVSEPEIVYLSKWILFLFTSCVVLTVSVLPQTCTPFPIWKSNASSPQPEKNISWTNENSSCKKKTDTEKKILSSYLFLDCVFGVCSTKKCIFDFTFKTQRR